MPGYSRNQLEMEARENQTGEGSSGSLGHSDCGVKQKTGKQKRRRMFRYIK